MPQALSKLEDDDLYAEFNKMRIKHPHHEAAVATFEKLRRRKKAAPNAEQTAASLFAGSRSGKTTTVKWYIEKVVAADWLEFKSAKADRGAELSVVEKLKLKPLSDIAELQTFALFVELSGATTVSGLISDFLEALGDPDPHGGTAKQRRFRVEKLLKERNYQIIFLDETQHIKVQTFAGSISRQEDASEVQNTLKRWVKRWPIVFVGTQHAENVVFEHQVYTRSISPIKFGPLHFGNPSDRKIFEQFCGRLSHKIVQHGILPELPQILVEGDVPLCLNIATKGRLGLVTVIVRMGLENMMQRGRLELEREDLARAVADYSVRIGICKTNPFTDIQISLPSVEEFQRDSNELKL
ncbi:AAA family ATPase [Rhizobium sp. S152]|uniref:AAA family ATPase n=1 Tax=Rhizobium sp. S152 TaxID=3055038 RepID=UPI0025A93197|nr:AAA family ATPase [Rhizobium sp. S152]MDM9628421.1 AAA family ATPase [Rhizobium sp. S152]